MTRINTQFVYTRFWQDSRFVFFTSLLLFALLVFLFPPFFSVNDDPYRAMIVSGTGIAGTPDLRLAYSNFLLGYVLKSFYSITPSINWYAYFLFACHGLGLAIILNVLLKNKKTILSALFFFLLIIDVLLLYLSMFNYTTTAFFLGLAAVVVWFDRCLKSEKKMALVLSFLFVSFLIRKEVFYLVLMINVPLYFAFSIFLKRNLKELIPSALKLAVLLAVTSALNLVDAKVNDEGSPHWNAEHSILAEWYNYGKVEFNERTEPYFKEVGWSLNDYRILMSPFLLWNVFDYDSLKKVEVKAFKDTGFDFKRGLFLTSDALCSKSVAVVLLWAVFSLFFVSLFNKQSWVRVGISLIWILFVIVLVGSRLKMVPYVYIPILSFFTMLCALHFEEGEDKRKTGVVTLLLAFITVWGIKAHAGVNRSRVETESLYLDTLKKLNPSSENLYVVWGPDLLVHFPRVSSPNLYPNMKLICTGWPLYTKVAQERLKEFQISDLYQALYEKENVYLVSDKGRESGLVEFIKAHYGVDVYFDPKFSSELLSVFKVRVKISQPPSE